MNVNLDTLETDAIKHVLKVFMVPTVHSIVHASMELPVSPQMDHALAHLAGKDLIVLSELVQMECMDLTAAVHVIV